MREGRLLDQNYDPGLETAEHTPGQINTLEACRLSELGLMASMCGVIPRRLGSEAMPAELSWDKKTCRRVAYVALKCEGMWLPEFKTATEVTDELRRKAAQVDWNSWWSGHQEFLHHRVRYLSTWALRNNEVQYGNHAVTNLKSERKWLDMIF